MNCEIFHQLPWYTIPHLGLSWHASAKAGTQTLLRVILREFNMADPGYGHRRMRIHKDLVAEGLVLAEQVPTGKWCEQIVRHPWDRFNSLLKDKCFGGGDGVPAEMYNIENSRELVDYIKRNPYGNVHWTPQSTVVGADAYVSIESFGAQQGFHENKTEKLEEGRSVRVYQEVMKLYRSDEALYRYAL